MLVDTDPPVLATVTRVLSRALFPLVITCGPFDLVSRTWLCCYVRTHHKKPVAVQKCIPTMFQQIPIHDVGTPNYNCCFYDVSLKTLFDGNNNKANSNCTH